MPAGNGQQKEKHRQLLKLPQMVTITKEELKDKIMGGWAGQTIGVTFGEPYEFRLKKALLRGLVKSWSSTLPELVLY